MGRSQGIMRRSEALRDDAAEGLAGTVSDSRRQS